MLEKQMTHHPSNYVGDLAYKLTWETMSPEVESMLYCGVFGDSDPDVWDDNEKIFYPADLKKAIAKARRIIRIHEPVMYWYCVALQLVEWQVQVVGEGYLHYAWEEVSEVKTDHPLYLEVWKGDKYEWE